MDLSSFPPPSYFPPISNCSSLYHLYMWHMPPLLLYWRRTPSNWTSPTLSILQTPPLLSTPHAACLRLTPFPMSVCPPFAALGLHPGPCHLLSFFTVVDSSVSLVSTIYENYRVITFILKKNGNLPLYLDIQLRHK